MDYSAFVNDYIFQANELINELFFSLVPLYKKENGDEQDVVVPLFTTLHATSQNVLVLLRIQTALHDADVLLRTVMEGTIKYCYLMNGTKDERHEKYIEYKHVLTEIEKISDHFKAIEAVKILKEFSINNTLPFEVNILSDEEIQLLQAKYTRKIKTEMKQKWSYQSLLKSLASNRPEYKAQLGTIATYSLSSHFCHYDWIGVSSRLAQLESAYDEKDEIYDILHCYRILSNILSFEMFRASEYVRANNFSSAHTLAIIDKIFELLYRIDSFCNTSLENEEQPRS